MSNGGSRSSVVLDHQEAFLADTRMGEWQLSCGSAHKQLRQHRPGLTPTPTDATAGASTKQPNTNIQSLPQLNVLGHPQHSLQLQKTIKQQ